jgi:DNA-binding LytR/AlgR family response regulator
MEKQVDRIAELSAAITALNAEKQELIDLLKAEGEGKYYGTKHYVVVSRSERPTLDMRAVKKKLSRQFKKLSRQFIVAHTRVTEVLSASLRGYNNKREAA